MKRPEDRSPCVRRVVLIDVRDWRGPRCSCGMILMGSVHWRGQCFWCAVEEQRRRAVVATGAMAVARAAGAEVLAGARRTG